MFPLLSARKKAVKCPHCGVMFPDESRTKSLESKPLELLPNSYPIKSDGLYLYYKYQECPVCNKTILSIVWGAEEPGSNGGTPANFQPRKEFMVIPRNSHAPPPIEVPQQIAKDYSESCVVLNDSSNASAALSRRCLQNILRDAGKVKPGTLEQEIQETIEGGQLPSYIIESLNHIRTLGNFAAHPMLNTQTRDVIDVEPAEAEYALGVIEALFNNYYVHPLALKDKKNQINSKLRAAGKKEIG